MPLLAHRAHYPIATAVAPIHTPTYSPKTLRGRDRRGDAECRQHRRVQPPARVIMNRHWPWAVSDSEAMLQHLIRGAWSRWLALGLVADSAACFALGS
jgi:hypothetical protein